MNRTKRAKAPAHLGYLLSFVARLVRDRTRDALAPLGLDTSHIGVLNVLESGGMLSQRELGRSLGIDRTTVVRLIDELQSIGLVAREPSEDRRINALRLTPAGEDIAARMEALVTATERDVFSALSTAQVSALRSALAATIKHVGRELIGAAPPPSRDSSDSGQR